MRPSVVCSLPPHQTTTQQGPPCSRDRVSAVTADCGELLFAGVMSAGLGAKYPCQEQPQRIIERYMKRIPEHLAAAAETNWDSCSPSYMILDSSA